MPDDILSLVIPAVLIGVIGLIVGGVAGFVLASIMQTPVLPEPKRPRGLSEIAHLWRSRRSGELVIEMEEKFIAGEEELNPRQREVLARLNGELRSWLGLGNEESARRAAEAAAPAKPAPVLSAPSVQPSAEKPSAPFETLQPAAVPPPPVVTPPNTLHPEIDLRSQFGLVDEPVKPVSADLGNILASTTRRRDKPGPEKAAPAKTITMQINEIIQERLPDSPYRNMVINITDQPRIGVQVYVNGQTFEGVGDVSDPQVRDFIRSCVAEWERRAGQ